ncbi:MAG: HD domain-containing protein [Armatimonadota bacterium]
MLHEDPDPLILVGLHVDGTDAMTLRPAFAWAVAAHDGQVRKDGSRLIDHVVGVARNVQRFDTDGDLDLLVAALLHDIVENTDVPLSEVEARFGPSVARLVDAVTNREGESAADSAFRARDVGGDALLLRLCDRLDGIRRSPGRPEGNRRKFLSASREVHLALAEEHFPALAEAMHAALAEAEATLE